MGCNTAQNIPSCDIATPPTSGDKWEKEFLKINDRYMDFDDDSGALYFDVNALSDDNKSTVDNYYVWEEKMKEFIRSTIRAEREKARLQEKMRILTQVKLEKPESAGVNDFQNGVYSGYLNAIDDLNAIRCKLRNNI